MKTICTLGNLRKKLDSLEEHFGDKLSLEYIYHNGSPTYSVGANGGESRYQTYNYLISVPSLGLEFWEGFDCTWEESEQKLYQWERVTFVSDKSDNSSHVCDDTVEELVEWYVREKNIEVGDIADLECVIETEFEAGK
ncbi:MAG: hypothetical protein IJ561_07590 [Ruminococcus sp.]|nr:hypothetical protein [Ruminococcus sp.]